MVPWRAISQGRNHVVQFLGYGYYCPSAEKNFRKVYTVWRSLLSHLPPTNTHTHTYLTALCPGLPGWAATRKAKPIWILLKQETASGSGISWAICKSAPRSRQISTPAPHHSVFLQAGCPFCRRTNSVKAPKDQTSTKKLRKKLGVRPIFFFGGGRTPPPVVAPMVSVHLFTLETWS